MVSLVVKLKNEKKTNDKSSLKTILHYIDATIVWHDLLIIWKDAESSNAAWDESMVTNLTSINDTNRAHVLLEHEVLTNCKWSL